MQFRVFVSIYSVNLNKEKLSDWKFSARKTELFLLFLDSGKPNSEEKN